MFSLPNRDWLDYASLFVSVFTMLGVLLVVLQFIGERIARHREFEMMYVQRYWEVSESLPTAFLEGRPNYEITEENRDAFVRYMLLCEDELDLRARGYITDNTWRVWESGIGMIASQDQLKQLVLSFPDTRLDKLRAVIGRGDSDPLKKSRPSKWWHGLS